MAESSDGPLGVIQTENDDVSRRFGPNTAEVEAFIQAVARLTPTEWKKVVAARKLVASVTKEGSGEAPDELQSIRAAMGSGEGRVSESMTRVGEALFEALETQTDENVVAAWQAVSALVLRQQLSALKFAAHYVPFATLIPVLGVSALDPTTRRFLSSLKRLTADQCASLARPWRLEHNTSRALLQAVANRGHLHVEEAVALRALATIPARLSGDAGWAAVRTVVHGGRVLSRRADLASDEVTVLWAPLQEMIPLESLEKVRGDEGAPKRVRAVTTKRTKPVKPPKVVVAKPPKAAALYGPNSAEVAAFVKAVVELTPIQWLRVLDRRQLVSSVTREGSAEPATVVRALFAGIEGTKELDSFTRCRAFVAVEQASFAVETKAAVEHERVVQQFSPFAGLIPEEVDSDEFVRRLASLNAEQWAQVAAAVPAVNEGVVAPLINAGTALIDFLNRRLDDETVATWHAVSALVRRRQLTPIKFAASYAPFASAIPVKGANASGAMLVRYLTAIGRLGGSQCEALAQPWQLSDEISNALSRAMKDGSARHAEEAAALAAVVTVPMRLSGSAGWAAVKTAAYGGRVIASRTRLTVEQTDELWRPIQPAIPFASLGAPAKVRH